MAPSSRKVVWFWRVPLAEIVTSEGNVFVLPSSALAGARTVPAVISARLAALRPFNGKSTTRRVSTTSLSDEVLVFTCDASASTVIVCPDLLSVSAMLTVAD
jgi:hypothetical protein